MRWCCEWTSRLASVAAGVCVVLALLASPALVKADDCGCEATCAPYGVGTMTYQYCMMNCMQQCTYAETCGNSNGQACTADSSQDPPTKCNAATDGKQCDKNDSKCICRFSKTKLDCTCGYAVGT